MSLLLRLLSGVAAEQPIAQEEWNWDEAAPADFVATGYQNSNAVQPRPQDHEWDWDEPALTDVTPTGYLQANAPAVPVVVQDDWDWSEGADDDWDTRPEQALLSVAQLPRQEGDAEWNWDEAVFGELVPAGYQNSNTTAVADPIQQFGFEWDWDEHVAGDIVPGGFQNADVVTVASTARAYDTEWDFDADGDAEDGWRNHYTAYDPVDPIQQFGFEWDWDETLFTDVVPGGSQNADVAVVVSTAQPPQADWDFDAEAIGEDGWANHYTAYDPSDRAYDTEWDWDECVYGDVIPTGYLQADVAQAPAAPRQLDDAWDWHEEIDDEWRAEDYQASFVPPSLLLCQEDPWAWFDEILFSDVAPTGYQTANGPAVPPPVVEDEHRSRRHRKQALRYIHDQKAYVEGQAVGQATARGVSVRVTNPAVFVFTPAPVELPPVVAPVVEAPAAPAPAPLPIVVKAVLPSAAGRAKASTVRVITGTGATVRLGRPAAPVQPVVNVTVRVKGVSARALARDPDEVWAEQVDEEDVILATIAKLFDRS